MTHSATAISALQSFSLEAPYGECESSGELEHYTNKTYTPDKCKVNCATKYIVKRCHCKVFYMPGEWWVGPEDLWIGHLVPEVGLGSGGAEG